MATYQVSDSYPPFDYGCAVRWRRVGLPMLIGSICGFRVVDSDDCAAAKNHPLGTVLALVEEGTGGYVSRIQVSNSLNDRQILDRLG